MAGNRKYSETKCCYSIRVSAIFLRRPCWNQQTSIDEISNPYKFSAVYLKYRYSLYRILQESKCVIYRNANYGNACGFWHENMHVSIFQSNASYWSVNRKMAARISQRCDESQRQKWNAIFCLYFYLISQKHENLSITEQVKLHETRLSYLTNYQMALRIAV